MSGTKIIAIVAGAILAIFLLLNFVFTETLDYYEAVWDNTVPSYVSFRDRYPNGKYIKETNERKSLLEEDYFAQKRKKDDLRAYEEFLHAFPADKYTAEATRLRDSLLQIQSDIEKYGNNTLPNGELPYQAFFGDNAKSTKKFNTDVVVVAPVAFDMIAMIKENDENGKVVAHAYVAADSTYTFNLDNGKYQMFFYIGNGWNPNKKMEDGVLGGFVRNETYSKDDPVSLANEVITYRLSMRQRKNSYKSSSRSEMFHKN